MGPPGIHCLAEYCQKDIGSEIHISCSVCTNFQLCLQVSKLAFKFRFVAHRIACSASGDAALSALTLGWFSCSVFRWDMRAVHMHQVMATALSRYVIITRPLCLGVLRKTTCQTP